VGIRTSSNGESIVVNQIQLVRPNLVLDSWTFAANFISRGAFPRIRIKCGIAILNLRGNKTNDVWSPFFVVNPVCQVSHSPDHPSRCYNNLLFTNTCLHTRHHHHLSGETMAPRARIYMYLRCTHPQDLQVSAFWFFFTNSLNLLVEWLSFARAKIHCFMTH